MSGAEATTTYPVDASRWPDLLELFGPSGGYDDCWCMFWRLPNQELRAASPEQRREQLSELVTAGTAGILAYRDDRPVGWCSVAPRVDYARVARTKALAPDDPDSPGVYAVTCFYIDRTQRRQGIASTLLAAAVEYARRRGAAMVEGYPVVSGVKQSAAMSTGTVELFTRAGFVEGGDGPASGRRTVVRKVLGD